jgi:hypothetical protein
MTTRRHKFGRLTGPLAGSAALVAVALVSVAGAVAAAPYSAWQVPNKLDEIAGNDSDINTPYVDGCPIQSPDGLSLYMASNRPRFATDTRTDLDIWVARRVDTSGSFGAPENLPSPINSNANDFCPTPVPRKRPVLRQRARWRMRCGRHLLCPREFGRRVE